MDVINEIWDTVLGDHVYAWLLPAKEPTFNISAAAQVTDKVPLPWHYVPATAYFSLQPDDAAYQSSWARDNIYRQTINLFVITWVFGILTYLVFAGVSYVFIFDKRTLSHPKFLKNQVRMEIKQTMLAMPVMSLLTVPFFLAELRGFTRCYDTLDQSPGIWYQFMQIPFFILFTDFGIYWIHRGLHHPRIYKTLHKPHHRWIMPTPFASHAFHPLDGWAQALPYHIYPLLFPLQKFVYVFLFVFVNFWTITIHDGEYMAQNPIVNGAACHATHHLYFNYNYGQYTTLWDRLCGSYRKPNPDLFAKEEKAIRLRWSKQDKEVENIIVKVERQNDRQYTVADFKKNA